MDASIINWDKAPSGNDLEVLSLFYSFIEVAEVLTNYEGGAEAVKSLKLEYDKVIRVSEEGFREWLKALTSVQYNEEQLSKEQIQALNDIQDYLKVPYNQVEQPIITGDNVRFEDLASKYGKK